MGFEVMMPLLFGIGSVAMVGIALAYAKARAVRDKEKARSLAAALGFAYEEGRAALEPLVESDGLSGQLAMLDRMPPFFRRLLEAGGLWRLRGEIEGVRVAVYPETRSHNKSSTTYTIVRAFYPKPLAYDLRIAKEGLFTKMGKSLFGLQDIEIGDPAFDPLVRVKSKDELDARILVGGDEAKRSILALLEAYPGAHATGEYAHWERVGLAFDPAEIRAVALALVPVAKALGGRR